FYMAFGGTSWGWEPAPVVYSSYDYGAGIDETRGLRDKALTLRQLGAFIAANQETLAGMQRGLAINASSPAIRLYHNVNPENRAHLIVAVHNPSNAVSNDAFTFDMPTGDGVYHVPQQGVLRLNGQDAKLLLANAAFLGQRLVYATSQLQTDLS